jgi:adenosylmethionine-8-amino-7-oxononanoate aminotransferase
MTLNSKDRQFVWHPFTHLKGASDNLCIVRGEGAYYFDQDQRKIIDAISSWWVNLHGHAHPYIAQKISGQLSVLEHAIFSGFTHTPAVELAERLISHLPKNQAKIFYSDDGSTAVEVALKMTLQYWNNLGLTKKRFISFENAYHGDTFGAMSVGARSIFNQAFQSQLFEVVPMPLPNQDNIETVKKLFLKAVTSGEIAGFIFEPLLQGAGGMKTYEPKFLDQLIKLAKDHKVICIADEVLTGFGRTGKFFASDYLENKPDIFCLSKGLTGGFLPLGVTSCAEFIYQAFVSSDQTKTFFHGHSYTANPTACAAGLASLDLMEKNETWSNINRITLSHQKFAKKLAGHPSLKEVRQIGTIIAFELQTEEATGYLNKVAKNTYQHFLSKGILLRPLGNVIYILPPYCMTDHDLAYIYSTIEEYLEFICRCSTGLQ